MATVQIARLKRPEMTVLKFIETVFIPNHVNSKRSSGRSYYRAILKHIITPEQIDRMSGIDTRDSRAKLQSIPDWPYLDFLYLGDVTSIHAEKLVAAGLKRGYSIQTVTHIRQVIRAIFSCARNADLFDGDNPALGTRIPAMVRKEAHTLTLAQTKRLLSMMKYPEREMALIAILVNMNVAEICGLQWKNVNLTGRPLNLAGKVIPPLSIAVREQWYRFNLDHVARSRERVVRIPELLLPTLIQLSCRTNYTGPEDFVLISRNGTPVCQTNLALRRLKPLGKAVNMPALTWNVFRRVHVALVKEFGEDFQYRIGIPASYEPPI